MTVRLAPLALIFLTLVGCSAATPQDDAGIDPPDASNNQVDAGNDSGIDSGVDSGIAAGPLDAGDEDGGVEVDAGIDAGPGDPCAMNNGGCDPLTQCTSMNQQVTCGACPSGYTGDGTSGCVDVDECSSAADAGCDATTFCANTPGSFRCVDRPNGVVLFDPNQTQSVGDVNATPHLQPCPQDQVSIGYSFGTNSLSKITGAGAICSPLTLSGSAATGFALTTTPPSVVFADDRVCPPNEVVVGMGVSFSTDLRSMTTRCAPLSVQLDSNSRLTVITGTPHELPRYPGASSPAPNFSVACPANTVGAGEVPYGGQYLFGFAMRCVRPAMAYAVPTISFGATSDTLGIGISSSTPSDRDLCPAGQVVTGVELESQWRSFAVECGTPVFDLPLRVAITPANPLAYHGALAPRFARGCPWDAALTHVEMFTQGTYILGIGLSCAPFTATSTQSIGVGATTVASPAPPYPGMPQQTTCPAGQVAVGVQSMMTTQSNGYRTLSHLGLICAAPQVP